MMEAVNLNTKLKKKETLYYSPYSIKNVSIFYLFEFSFLR